MDGSGLRAFNHPARVEHLMDTECYLCTWVYVRGIRTLKFASNLCPIHQEYKWGENG